VTALAPVLEAFFTERLAQRQASPHTVASYRDTYCLLLRYAHKHLGKPPSRLDFTDLDAPLIGAFLAHLEAERGNSMSEGQRQARVLRETPPGQHRHATMTATAAGWTSRSAAR
jgi:site-specific recombinase XerC